MTEPDKMTPGELVRFLAVEVMGWTYGDADFEILPPLKAHWKIDGIFKAYATWNPLTDANDMLMVIEAMAKKHCYSVDIHVRTGNLPSNRRYVVRVTSYRTGTMLEEYKCTNALGLAVCRAAAKAILAEKEKV